MKKNKFLLILSMFLGVHLLYSQNPLRTVLYTLKKNEILKYNEYYISCKLEKNKFAAVVTDTIVKEDRFIFNGEVIFSNSEIRSAQANNSSVVLDFDLNKSNGYIYKYKKSDKWFVNIGGKVEGPFEEVYNERFELTDDGRYGNQRNYNGCYGEDYGKVPSKFDFCYKLGDNWFSNTNGKIEMIESPYEIPERSYGGTWSTTIENKHHYNKISGVDIYPPLISDSTLDWDYDTRNQDVACVFVKNGNKYFYFNGTISEPFDNDNESNYVHLTSENYIYTFRKDKKKYININGKQYDLFDGAIRYNANAGILKNKGVFYTYEKNKKQYFFIDGKNYGPYDDFVYNSIIVHDNGKFAFIYQNGKDCIANINGQTSVGYLNLYSLSFYSDGTFRYYFEKKDGWVYENNNGQISKTENRIANNPWSGTDVGRRLFDISADKYEIKSTNNKHVLITDIKYNYVIVDGRSFGSTPAIKAWYDETRNAFIWNSWENKELVTYEFKLD